MCIGECMHACMRSAGVHKGVCVCVCMCVCCGCMGALVCACNHLCACEGARVYLFVRACVPACVPAHVLANLGVYLCMRVLVLHGAALCVNCLLALIHMTFQDLA